MQNAIRQLLNSRDLAHLRNLTIGSRFTVEGNLQGMHRSPNRGFSVEFADYRQYVSGDDLKHLDWKVYARNERLYVRQYEEERNLRVYLLVDGSRSMAFRGEGMSKYDFACRLAAALAYVTMQQHDSVGFTLFDTERICELPARPGRRQLRIIAEKLLQHEPARPTSLADTLHRLAEHLQRRAVIAIISDLFDDLPAVDKALSHFRRRHHDVMVYHVLDPVEIEFPFVGAGTFEDMESGARVTAEPREIRHAYQQAVGDFLRQCRAICANLDIDYCLASGESSASRLASRHLARRDGRARFR